jgi:DNA-binding NarL/FixJ family response regulator
MHKPHILVYGVQAGEVDRIVSVLSGEGKYRIHKAYFIGEALEIIKRAAVSPRHKVKLVVFQAQMPTGIEVLKRIIEEAPDLRTVIISADSYTDCWLNAYLECNAVAYLPGPADEEELRWLVDLFFKGEERFLKNWTFLRKGFPGRG